MKFANGMQDGNLAKRRHIQSDRKKKSKNYQRDVDNRKKRYNQEVMESQEPQKVEMVYPITKQI